MKRMAINFQTTGWIYQPNEIDVASVLDSTSRIPKRQGNPGRKNRPVLLDMVCTFDIETTRMEDIEQSVMYVWQMRFGNYTIMGRSWDEWLEFLQRCAAAIKPTERIVCYIHNASYEFQFIQGIYTFTEDEVFLIDRRKVARFEMFGAWDFRCSYIHSNMSLDQFAKKMQCTVRKLTGTFDYSLHRFPWTELTESEIAYCVNDVLSLQEAIEKEMALDGDTLDTIPLTSTGYVRRDAKKALKSKPAFHTYISDQLPDFELYLALREAFRGGNTHANRFIVGDILHNVHSVDRSSSYPDVLVNHKFPISYFAHRGPCTMERFLINKNKHHKAIIIRIALWNVRLKNFWDPCPYLSKDKCRLIHNGLFDNGRILEAIYLETTLTDVDWDIIAEHYDFNDPCIFDSWSARYGFLPDEFRQLVCKMYADKTIMKGDPGQKIYYEKIKNKINALYGMTAQNPLRQEYKYWDHRCHPDLDDPEEVLEKLRPKEADLQKYNRTAFLAYQWGVWVTAWARWELQWMIDAVGDGVHTESQFVYCDTDSVKYTGDISKQLQIYNEKQMAISLTNGGAARDSKGEMHYLGIYEQEHDYDRFRTWGAKRYAYDQDGICYVTTAGVVKRKGSSENAGGEELTKMGGLDAYKPGVTFRDSGGIEAVYNDDVHLEMMIDGHPLTITDNVVLRPSTYTLGITGEYEKLLTHVDLLFDLWLEHQHENWEIDSVL